MAQHAAYAVGEHNAVAPSGPGMMMHADADGAIERERPRHNANARVIDVVIRAPRVGRASPPGGKGRNAGVPWSSSPAARNTPPAQVLHRPALCRCRFPASVLVRSSACLGGHRVLIVLPVVAKCTL